MPCILFLPRKYWWKKREKYYKSIYSLFFPILIHDLKLSNEAIASIYKLATIFHLSKLQHILNGSHF